MITFRPGNNNGKADPLTRRSGDLPKEGNDHAQPIYAIVLAKKFLNPVLCHSVVKHTPDIRTALKCDSRAQEIMTALQNGTQRHLKVLLTECGIKNDLLYVYGLLYVTDNKSIYRKIIYVHHDHPATRHPAWATAYKQHTVAARDVIFGRFACLSLRFYCFAFVKSVHGSDFYGGSDFPVCDGRFPVADVSVCCLCFSVCGFPSLLLSLSSDFDLDWCVWKFSPVSHLYLFLGAGWNGWQGW